MKSMATEKKSIFNSVYRNLPKIYFLLQIVIGLYAAYWVLFNHQPKTGDDVEHLHSAWLVFEGKLPYRDFFQHHNPLLWYLFAPLVGFFAYDITIFDVVRIISTGVMFLVLFLLGRISEKFICHSKYAALLTVASVFPSYILFSGQDFRPDNYMVASFIVGLYFFFSYLEYKKSSQLILSFFFMFLTFMFMQKSIFFLGLFGLMVCFLLYTKEVNFNDFLKALVLPIFGAIFFLCWLIHNDILELYWRCNFTFNLYIPDVYNGLSEKTRTEFYVLSFFAFLGCVWFLKQGNTAARIICILWISEAIQRFFFFTLDRHYYYLLDVLNAILVGSFAYTVIKKWPWTAYIWVALSVAGMFCFRSYCLKFKLPPEYHRYVTPKFIVEQTNRCDAVLNGYGLTYGIFTKDLTYFWNLNGQLDVIGNEIGLGPIPDLNQVVERYLPRVIYTGPYWHEKMHKRNHDVVVHFINPEIRDKYYVQSIFVDMFILKDEYQQKRRCRYDAVSNSWNYYYKE